MPCHAEIQLHIENLPPSFIKHSITTFDDYMRETLADLAGRQLSNWGWQKASLPISFGGLNLHSVNLHAPAAFISSLAQSKLLMAGIMNHAISPSTYITEAVSMLADAVKVDDWLPLDDIDVPLHQRALSCKIDEACYNFLLATAPDTHSSTLALSDAISHAGDWLSVVPSTALGLYFHSQEFHLSLKYWLGLRIMEKIMYAHFAKVRRWQTLWVTIKSVAAGKGTSSIGLIPSGIPSSLWFSLLPWPA